MTFLMGRGCDVVAFKPIPACKSGPATAAYFNSSLRVIRFLAPELTAFLPDDFMMALLNDGVETPDIEL